MARICSVVGRPGSSAESETELCATPGNPVVLARTPRKSGARRPHYVVYGHSDVPPAEPARAQPQAVASRRAG